MLCYHYIVVPNTGPIELQLHELWLPNTQKLVQRLNLSSSRS